VHRGLTAGRVLAGLTRGEADQPDRPRARRAVPLLLVAGASFVWGVGSGARHIPASQRTVESFTEAWERGDYARMYTLVDERTRSARPLTAFAEAYARAAATATVRHLRFGPPRRPEGERVSVPVVVATRAFGTIRATITLPTVEEDEGTRVAWSASLAFPGLEAGERLSRRTVLPPRAALLARDNSPLAAGEPRASPLGAAAAAVAGRLGPIPADRAQQLRAAGYPEDALVGVSGLEKSYEQRLAGTPGGQLLAGRRILASRPPRSAAPLRTTIAPRVQHAAVAALGDRLGGVVAMRPRTGEVLGVAGIGFSGLQPPGSTFKIVTLVGALAAGAARTDTRFPFVSYATLSGVRLANANDETCGGTLRRAFAHSCNSVFAPLGVRLGARDLVATAERFGFNAPPGIPGAATPTIPQAERIGDDLAVGSTAIGQGRVQATALTMAVVAATIALHGRRPRPALVFGVRRAAPRVIESRVARTVERLMLEVVRSGTGTAAAIRGVKVAGKTGTAELKSTQPRCEPATVATRCPEQAPNDPTDTDAWFAAYAPVGRPRIAVGVLVVRAGAGGETAAPVARAVLAAGLGR
jgi:peptidoglycan glycosyltransferase